MTTTTMEGNRIIAEFMAMKKEVDHSREYFLLPNMKAETRTGWYQVDSMQYHTSWDWLIPACHKWDNLDVSNLSADDREAYIFMCELLDNCIILYEIEPVHEQLIDCLKWYYVTNTSNSCEEK